MRDDFVQAEPLFESLLAAARDDDNGVGMSSCRINLAWIANRTRRHERARALLAENLPFVRSRGQARCEASTLIGLVETLDYLEQPTAAIEHAIAAAAVAPRAADASLLLEDLRWYSIAAAQLGDARRIARILGACERAEEELDAALEPYELVARDELIDRLRRTLGDPGFADERSLGRTLSPVRGGRSHAGSDRRGSGSLVVSHGPEAMRQKSRPAAGRAVASCPWERPCPTERRAPRPARPAVRDRGRRPHRGRDDRRRDRGARLPGRGRGRRRPPARAAGRDATRRRSGPRAGSTRPASSWRPASSTSTATAAS